MLVSRSLIVALLGVAPFAAFAQFSDSKEDHWAAQALERMRQDGLLVGYPDSLFRGGRPVSRYELAVALHASFQAAVARMEGISKALAQVDARIQGSSPAGTPSDLTGLREAVTKLNADAQSLKAFKKDLDDLQALARRFEFELTGLGVQTGDMVVRLKKLTDQVTALEGEAPKWRASGDVSTFFLGSGGSTIAMDRDGRIAQPGGLTDTMSVFNELYLRMESVGPGPRWEAAFTLSTLVGSGFTNTVGSPVGASISENEPTTDLERLNATVNLPALGGTTLRFGRFGSYGSELSWRRPDTTTSFVNPRLDDGEYRVDGLQASVGVGRARLTTLAARASRRQLTPTTFIPAPLAGELDLDQVLGLNLDFSLRRDVELNVSSLWADNDSGRPVRVGSTAFLANRTQVLDASLRVNRGPWLFQGAYAGQTWRATGASFDRDTTSWFARLAYRAAERSWSVAYRSVDANFRTPGDWGRVGVIRNPNNVEGVDASADLKLSERLAVGGQLQLYRVKDRAANGTLNAGLEDVNRFAVAATYQLNPKVKLGLGYESSQFAATIGGDPRYAWTTFGLELALSELGELRLGYDLNDIHNALQSIPASRLTGGILTTQLTMRF